MLTFTARLTRSTHWPCTTPGFHRAVLPRQRGCSYHPISTLLVPTCAGISPRQVGVRAVYFLLHDSRASRQVASPRRNIGDRQRRLSRCPDFPPPPKVGATISSRLRLYDTGFPVFFNRSNLTVRKSDSSADRWNCHFRQYFPIQGRDCNRLTRFSA